MAATGTLLRSSTWCLPMPDLILVPGSLLIPAAYVVFYDPVSATTFGRNGKTAKLDQYNSDSATVFNAVLSSV